MIKYYQQIQSLKMNITCTNSHYYNIIFEFKHLTAGEASFHVRNGLRTQTTLLFLHL